MCGDHKGYTLVETIVTLSILSLVILLSAMLILSGSDVVTRDSESNTVKYIGDSVCAFIENRIQYATKLEITAGAPNASYANSLTVADGRLQLASGSAATDVFGADYYHGYHIVLTVTPDAAHTAQTVLLHVSVRSADDEEKYLAEATVKLVNMGISNNYLVSAADSYTDPAICYSSADVIVGSTPWDSLNQVMLRYQLQSDRYDALKLEYDAAKTGPARKEVLQRFKDYFGTANSSFGLTRDQYNTFLYQRFGGIWPTLESEALAPLQNSSDSRLQAIYRAVTTDNGKAITLGVRPYFLEMSGYIGRANSVIYYATSNNTDTKGWRAQLIYDTNDSAWYVYDTVRASAPYYSMANVYSNYATLGDFLSYVENSGEWIKLGEN